LLVRCTALGFCWSSGRNLPCLFFQKEFLFVAEMGDQGFTTLRGVFLKQGRIVKSWKEREFELTGMVCVIMLVHEFCLWFDERTCRSWFTMNLVLEPPKVM
jgi:hypothetical protein